MGFQGRYKVCDFLAMSNVIVKLIKHLCTYDLKKTLSGSSSSWFNPKTSFTWSHMNLFWIAFFYFVLHNIVKRHIFLLVVSTLLNIWNKGTFLTCMKLWRRFRHFDISSWIPAILSPVMSQKIKPWTSA